MAAFPSPTDKACIQNTGPLEETPCQEGIGGENCANMRLRRFGENQAYKRKKSSKTGPIT
jgi:hypothetical protein